MILGTSEGSKPSLLMFELVICCSGAVEHVFEPFKSSSWHAHYVGKVRVDIAIFWLTLLMLRTIRVDLHTVPLTIHNWLTVQCNNLSRAYFDAYYVRPGRWLLSKGLV